MFDDGRPKSLDAAKMALKIDAYERKGNRKWPPIPTKESDMASLLKSIACNIHQVDNCARCGPLIKKTMGPVSPFQECDTCRAKPGAPTLCAGCLQNRESISQLSTDGQHEALNRLSLADQLVRMQADDTGLWFNATTATEAYLQQHLRRLHAVIRGE